MSPTGDGPILLLRARRTGDRRRDCRELAAPARSSGGRHRSARRKWVARIGAPTDNTTGRRMVLASSVSSSTIRRSRGRARRCSACACALRRVLVASGAPAAICAWPSRYRAQARSYANPSNPSSSRAMLVDHFWTWCACAASSAELSARHTGMSTPGGSASRRSVTSPTVRSPAGPSTECADGASARAAVCRRGPASDGWATASGSLIALPSTARAAAVSSCSSAASARTVASRQMEPRVVDPRPGFLHSLHFVVRRSIASQDRHRGSQTRQLKRRLRSGPGVQGLTAQRSSVVPPPSLKRHSATIPA